MCGRSISYGYTDRYIGNERNRQNDLFLLCLTLDAYVFVCLTSTRNVLILCVDIIYIVLKSLIFSVDNNVWSLIDLELTFWRTWFDCMNTNEADYGKDG